MKKIFILCAVITLMCACAHKETKKQTSTTLDTMVVADSTTAL